MLPPVPNVHSIKPQVYKSEARTDARVTFSNGQVYSGLVGTPLLHFVQAAYPHDPQRIIGAVINNQLGELTIPVTSDSSVIPLSAVDADGARIYRRSLVFLMTAAAQELFPGVKISVQHSITTGGYYCEALGRPNFTDDDLDALRQRMEEIIALDEPFVRSTMPLADAKRLFSDNGDDDMLRLLEMRTKNYLTVYSLRGQVDYLFGYMAPSAGYLRVFDICRSDGGFILRFPRAESPDHLMPYHPSEKMEAVFRRFKAWQNLMGLPDIGALNQSIAAGRFREEVLLAEALHSRYIGEIAGEIARRHAQHVRLVLIAGPSSSGKTTFSKRLAVQLMAYGIRPFTLAMDDYFVDRELTPRDEAGEYDFEALGALDRPNLNRDLLALMAGQETTLPVFDFSLGKRKPSHTVRLSDAHIIIAEGIHGLNPELLSEIPPERIYRIYVSALTALNLDRHNRVPTTDIRLLRRIVRDAARRGYSAEDTIARWPSVRRGELRNIFPYQENADVMFNSGLLYELAVLRPLAEPLLRQVEPGTPRYIEAKRLLAFLRWVRPTTPDYVPDDSLLREFIGGSILETYTPGGTQPVG